MARKSSNRLSGAAYSFRRSSFDPHEMWNDVSFIAKAREFRNIMVMATQSLAALSQKAYRRGEVEAFVNNCNNRILFYCDDPWTQLVANRLEGTDLSKLDSGQVVFIKFDLLLRRHEKNIDRLDGEHDILRSRLNEASPNRRNPTEVADEPRIALHDIWAAVEEFKPKKEETPSPSNHFRREGRPAERESHGESNQDNMETRSPWRPGKDPESRRKDRTLAKADFIQKRVHQRLLNVMEGIRVSGSVHPELQIRWLFRFPLNKIRAPARLPQSRSAAIGKPFFMAAA